MTQVSLEDPSLYIFRHNEVIVDDAVINILPGGLIKVISDPPYTKGLIEFQFVNLDGVIDESVTYKSDVVWAFVKNTPSNKQALAYLARANRMEQEIASLKYSLVNDLETIDKV